MAVQAQVYPENLASGFPLWGASDNGCGEFSFNLLQRNQNLFASVDPSYVDHHHRSVPAAVAFSSQAQEQRQEFDRFIAVQNERLKSALQQQRRQLLATLLGELESKALPLLKQKDEEIARAAKKAAELESFSMRLEMEKQAWQRMAMENEAMVQSLSRQLEELRERAAGRGAFISSVETELDAESCCEISPADSEAGDGENQWSSEPMDGWVLPCRSCNSAASSVMLLPCRHLSSCMPCAASLHFCPVCRAPKKAAMEVAMF